MDDGLCARYPRLASGHFAVTSPATDEYNCVAWAAGQDTGWWDPIGFWWPAGAPTEWSLSTVAAVFEMMGYQRDSSPALEPRIEKIAIYGFADDPKHVARQLESGYWSSKLGRNVDVEHELDGVTGSNYGDVLMIMSRPRQTADPQRPLLLVRRRIEDAVGA